MTGVVRAWPARQGGVTFEQRDPAGLLRAGRVDAWGDGELAGYATDPRLPELSAPSRGRLVVHRLGRRAVVLCPDRAVKLLRPGRAAPVAAVSRRLAELSAGTGLRAARVLDATEARVEFTLLPGRSLRDLGDDGLAGWAQLAAAWPLIARHPDQAPTRHSAADEAAVLNRWYTAAAEHGALGPLGPLRRAVEQVCAQLVAGTGPPVLLHRDLHDGQLLWDGAALGVLDLDTAARGEAALDVGNLLAHAELSRLTGALSAPGHRRVTGHLMELARQLEARPDRVGCYWRAARLRLAFVHAFRPAADRWLARWVESCLARPRPP
ncbi:phosphotransferase [Propionibacterium australiense]|nr:phosphotransferase [Propionibacterium australiense]